MLDLRKTWNSWVFINALLEQDAQTLRIIVSTLPEEHFEQVYAGAVLLQDVCQEHINFYGLEHLRERYER